MIIKSSMKLQIKSLCKPKFYAVPLNWLCLILFLGDFNWDKYLQQTGMSAAPSHCFKQQVFDDDNPNKFEISDKLEAKDARNPSAISVATIVQIQVRVKISVPSKILTTVKMPKRFNYFRQKCLNFCAENWFWKQ